MDKEKIVVILLLATIILSIGSIVVTFSLNTNNILGLRASHSGQSANAGNVNLIVEPNPAASNGGAQ